MPSEYGDGERLVLSMTGRVAASPTACMPLGSKVGYCCGRVDKIDVAYHLVTSPTSNMTMLSSPLFIPAWCVRPLKQAELAEGKLPTMVAKDSFREVDGHPFVVKLLTLNEAAFVRESEALENDRRHVVDIEDQSCSFELTRAMFAEEVLPKPQPASAPTQPADEANPWAQAPQSLIKAAAKHLFL
jgi:hypothetical protein